MRGIKNFASVLVSWCGCSRSELSKSWLQRSACRTKSGWKFHNGESSANVSGGLKCIRHICLWLTHSTNLLHKNTKVMFVLTLRRVLVVIHILGCYSRVGHGESNNQQVGKWSQSWTIHLTVYDQETFAACILVLLKGICSAWFWTPSCLLRTETCRYLR
jgi:hypothetical protein